MPVAFVPLHHVVRLPSFSPASSQLQPRKLPFSSRYLIVLFFFVLIVSSICIPALSHHPASDPTPPRLFTLKASLDFGLGIISIGEDNHEY
jgi:hypothetical protein